ncbi:MAG: hypothetical protein JXR76_32625 [Deltaproteobacteria bacterium]|nr:hypothetical protein [Deltaproteobacteria bacterium]
MKIYYYLLFIVAALPAACAGAPKAPRDARSENFEVTSKYLDLGGTVYTYMDVEGDVEKAAALVNELVAVVDEIPPKYKARIDAVQIVKALGLTDIQAIGMSSYKNGDRYINKSFTKTTYPRTGLMQYFGGEPHPFEILQMAPENAILAYEGDVNMQAFLETLYGVMQDVADADVIADVNRHLDSPIVGAGMTYRQLISQLDTKIMGVVALDPTRRMKIPDTELEIPLVEAFIAVDNMGPLMDLLVMKAKELPVFSVWEDSQWQRIGVSEFLTEELLDYRPVLWRHKVTQRLYIATGSQFLEDRLKHKNALGESPGFKELAASVPVDKGNGLIYISPDVYNSVVGIVDDALAKESELTSVRKVVDVLASKVSPGMVWVSQNTHDGIYQVASASFSHKLTLLGSIYANQLYGITMLGAASKYIFQQAVMGALFNSFTPNPSPTPSMPEGNESPGNELEKNSGDGPASPSGSKKEMPEHVEEFLKKWQQEHPGDAI